MKLKKTLTRSALAGVLLVTGACATGSQEKADVEKPLTELDNGPAKGTMGAFVRALGEAGGANVVLMNGCEDMPGPSVVKGTPPNAETLKTPIPGLATASGADYLFIFPDQAPYHELAKVVLADHLDPAHSETRVTFTMGADTPLFTAFALLGHATGKTLVADNSLAEALCGELALTNVPIGKAIEAIAKSARVVSYDVESTSEYIFVRSPKNRHANETLYAAENLTEAQREVLDRWVDVYLPQPPGKDGRLMMLHKAETLASALPPLSRQLGVTIIAEKSLLGFPVNPAVFRQVKVRTALDLLLRQWLVEGYCFEFRDDRILIRKRQSGEPVQPGPAPTTAVTSIP